MKKWFLWFSVSLSLCSAGIQAEDYSGQSSNRASMPEQGSSSTYGQQSSSPMYNPQGRNAPGQQAGSYQGQLPSQSQKLAYADDASYGASSWDRDSQGGHYGNQYQGQYQGQHQGGQYGYQYGNQYQGQYQGDEQYGYGQTDANGHIYGGSQPDEVCCGQSYEVPCGDSYCLYCKYEPCYYNTYRCVSEPHTCQKKCWRYVPQYYDKCCVKYEPKYYNQTCCKYVPECYYTTECYYTQKRVCDKHCKWVPKYYYKHIRSQQGCDTGCDTGNSGCCE